MMKWSRVSLRIRFRKNRVKNVRLQMPMLYLFFNSKVQTTTERQI